MTWLYRDTCDEQAERLQRALVGAGYEVGVDGHAGAVTFDVALEALGDHAHRLERIPLDDLVEVLEQAAAERAVSPPPAPIAASGRLSSFGVWLGRTSRQTYDEQLDVLDMVIDGQGDAPVFDRVDIMANAEGHGRETLDLYDRAWLRDVAARARAGGMRVSLTLWAIRTTRYLDELAAVAPELADDLGAEDIVLDAEGGWSKAPRRAPTVEAAAARLVDRWDDPFERPVGASSYGLASAKTFRPLVSRCDFAVPQIYTTKTNTKGSWNPRLAAAWSVAHWREHLCRPDQRIHGALAGYRQAGLPGYAGQARAVPFREALEALEAVEGVDSVSYWWAPTLAGSADLLRVIREHRTGAVA